MRSRVLTHYQKCQDNAPGGDDLHNIRSLFSSEIYIKSKIRQYGMNLLLSLS